MLNVPTHGARQNRFFDVAPFLDEILELIAVRDAALRPISLSRNG